MVGIYLIMTSPSIGRFQVQNADPRRMLFPCRSCQKSGMHPRAILVCDTVSELQPRKDPKRILGMQANTMASS